MDKKELKFFLSTIYPFNEFKRRQVVRFLQICEIKEYLNGETVYQEKSSPDYLYILITGRVLVLTEEGGNPVKIELLKRGTCFGIISLLTDEPHSVTTVTIEDSCVVRVPKEAFRLFLDKSPSVSLAFSRLLSQRVKRRVSRKKVFQSQRVAVCGPKSVGKTLYMHSLAVALRAETKKEIISVEFSFEENFQLALIINRNNNSLLLSEFREETIDQFIQDDGVDTLLVKVDQGYQFVSLLNCLSEKYHYIIYEFPLLDWERRFEVGVSSAHYIYFLTDKRKDSIENSQNFIESLKKRNFFTNDKVKIIATVEDGDREFSGLLSGALNQPVYATLGSKENQDYQKCVRRIARQLGGVVCGLALGSGGAYGYAHIGVLEALEDNSITVDVIAGSSIGAFIGALWCLGLNRQDIFEKAREFGQKISKFSLLGAFIPVRGFLRAKRLEKILHDIFKDATFYDLKRNFKLVVFDFLRREIKIIDKGFLYKAVAASCAMPGIFEPITVEGEVLMDGGILNPLPAKTLIKFGVDKIISVNITPTKEEMFKVYQRKAKLHIFDFIFGSIETMQQEFIYQAVKASDVVIHPAMEGLNWTEFSRIQEFIERGRSAACDKMGQIKALVEV
ncbi:MAG: patatin-like phospholipase family protein [Candidatus Omnitrophica bacterium]|nr:patatin-like phospholipase family protein [Candidatus Omnitrophota bacterium]